MIGRFISADSIVQSYNNPQSLNRYSYVFNNPLKYVDPSGSIVELQYENNVSAYISGMMQYGIVGGAGSYMDQMFQEYSTYQQVWNDIKQEMPVEAKAMEQAKETYFIGSSTSLEIYTSDCKQLYPITRSTTQIEGLPDISRGYSDINIAIPSWIPGVTITGGVMYYREGNKIVGYPYGGFGIGTPSISASTSWSSVSPSPLSVAFQGTYYATFQGGYSFDSQATNWSSDSGFLEFGVSYPKGLSFSAFSTFTPFEWSLPWYK
jgi:hypothetical protein